MSVREDDNQKNCPSRGLGLAAAAIGVGVGAALYYFFSKGPDNPTASGSTSGAWHCDTLLERNNSDDSYSTISEHSTTDTSIIEDDDSSSNYCDNSEDSHSERDATESDDSETCIESSFIAEDNSETSSVSTNDESDQLSDASITMEFESDNDSMSCLNNYDFIPMHLDVPSYSPTLSDSSSNSFLFSLFTPRRPTSRERSRTEEQCSICFDMIQPNQECMSLPCTHFFHTSCILPWLQEQQTCPNCRKNID